jgi:TolB-like protein/Tfp pilus assembly protein PilF
MTFFNELKRRNVLRVGAAYIVFGWLTAQVAEFATENFGAPEWVLKIYVVFLMLGLPLVLIFAWAFEMTPQGIKLEKDVDRSQSITGKTGRKLDFTIIGVMAIALTYFVWESRFQDETPAEARHTLTKPDIQLTATGNAVSPQDNSIAVLPFANRSNLEDDMFFTDGIHDDLLTQLAKISGLRVTSRTSVMEYRDTTKKIPEIAAELGVSTILEGGIQRAGDRIRINAQLINVATDEHLWAETFDREMTVENLFDIQSEITRQIVIAVRGELSDAENDALETLPTKNLQAYEAYLHARAAINQADYTQEKFITAESWLLKAVELDSQFALAWAALVSPRAQAIWSARDESETQHQLVIEALNKAKTLAPNLPETLAASGEYLYRIKNDYQEAEKSFRAASKAKPGDTDLLTRLGLALRRTGKFEESISVFQLANELDPGTVWPRTLMVETLMGMGEFDRAEPLIDLWMEKYPDAMDIRGFKVQILIERDGNLAAARAFLDQLQPWPGNPYILHTTFLPFLERDFQKAIDAWELAGVIEATKSGGWEYWKLLSIGSAHLFIGNAELAADFFQKCIEAVLGSDSSNDSSKSGKLQVLSQAYALSGQDSKAFEASNQARQLLPESRDSLNGAYASDNHAFILALTGHREEALVEIERLLDTPAGLNRWNLYLSPHWDFFRDDDRFNVLARPLNLEEAGK